MVGYGWLIAVIASDRYVAETSTLQICGSVIVYLFPFQLKVKNARQQGWLTALFQS